MKQWNQKAVHTQWKIKYFRLRIITMQTYTCQIKWHDRGRKKFLNSLHCIKYTRIRTFSDPYSLVFSHILRSVTLIFPKSMILSLYERIRSLKTRIPTYLTQCYANLPFLSIHYDLLQYFFSIRDSKKDTKNRKK